MTGASVTAFEKGKTRVFGRSVSRIEDLPLVTGRGRYVADLDFPRQIHMRVVRSEEAHGRIVAIRLDAARAVPGVVAVWTHADIAGLPPIDFRDPAAEALKPYRQPLLAKGVVRYVGEPVAVVLAESPYVAEDAAELVAVEVEALPPLLDAAAPPAAFAPGLSTEALELSQEYGDVAAAFREAHCIVEAELSIGRHSGVPMECRGAIGRYDAAYDVLELWGAAKVPHRNREALARFFGRPSSSVQLHECHVGGGFGIRGELYPEDFLVCAASMRLGCPVKWIEDRREHLIAANHSRQQHHRVRAAVDAEGRILALEDAIFLDQGAYVRTHGARVLDLTLAMLPGPYRVPAFRAVGHFRLTNKTPAATYRAPGRYEGTFVRERLLDAIAARLGLDGVAIRRRNLIASNEMPYARQLTANGHPIILDSGDYAGLLRAALEAFGWEETEARLRERRAAGEFVGAGLSFFLEKSGQGPSDSALVSVDSGGFVEVVTGGASLGQGFETAMAQICAETLGVDYRRVRVVHGQTDRIRFGIGAHASRATVMTGGAVHAAASEVRRKALAQASVLLQAPADELDIVEGRVVRRDAPMGASISLGELSRASGPGRDGAGNGMPGLYSESWFHTEGMAFPYGVHIAVVRVDRATGQVAVERYFVATDVGRAVNPMMVEGQITGGVVQGLGGALYEEFRYDAAGQPLSATFAAYLMPTMREAPKVEVLIAEDAPSPNNPLGIKGVGEGGCTGAGAAIASAIDAAIGRPGAVTALPATPERVLSLLEAARR
ncbi:MAG TPA: xanthine dehydrogenase family protein molybdopterin-binding subunit [Stellaceae bacterium]|nr:xanthine dehydrogenase family protein molybdopterin-binding subunit [Stellaceae bacterium]